MDTGWARSYPWWEPRVATLQRDNKYVLYQGEHGQHLLRHRNRHVGTRIDRTRELYARSNDVTMLEGNNVTDIRPQERTEQQGACETAETN